MAKRERQKRSSRQARQRERVEKEALLENSESSQDKKVAKASSKSVESKKAKDKKPGFFGRIRNYFRAVRSEMGRVTWPSRQETKNYSVAVIVTLLIFGVCIWLVDTGFVALLVGFTGLRG